MWPTTESYRDCQIHIHHHRTAGPGSQNKEEADQYGPEPMQIDVILIRKPLFQYPMILGYEKERKNQRGATIEDSPSCNDIIPDGMFCDNIEERQHDERHLMQDTLAPGKPSGPYQFHQHKDVKGIMTISMEVITAHHLLVMSST